MSIWPPLQPISSLITEIESSGLAFSVVEGRIRAVPAGRITVEQAETLKQRRSEAVAFLASREASLHTEGRTAPGGGGTASPADGDADASDAAPVVWLIYLGTDDREHAITKDDYDDARQWIWPADCPMPDPPIKTDKRGNAVRKRWVAIPSGEYPTAWVAPVYLEDGTMFTREREKQEVLA